MKPHIEDSKFGSITIDGQTFDHDVVIELSGEIHKRNKRLSKEVYGTSHIISLEEAKDLFERGTERIIIGSGQNGMLVVSKEAMDFFEKHDILVDVLVTPKAIVHWNAAEGQVVGLFHVTC
ncbi:MAG: MTH938/NDUFAF3 family protein [Bacteroidota bacterium]|nr:MTH938/NDUFAF3 family protein [Bacteroidota bacterium]